ncbi:3-isopropylmalate dehydrogenase [candidate division KSB1 bacterium]
MINVVILPGDGIGQEVSNEAVKVIRAIEKRFDLKINISEEIIGGASLDKFGIPVKEEVLDRCRNADAVFLGAIGGPKWDNNPSELRPEKALLALRKVLNAYINLRPIKIFKSLIDSSPLKPELLENVDILIVRELTGGLYFGEKKIEKTESGEHAVDTMEYSTFEIERIAKAAFDAAKIRRKKVTSVDKNNILATSQLWRRVVIEFAKDYPDIELDHLLVDNAAMQLVRYPAQFDVILTENTFGDILSDEAAMLTGSLGMLPSASLGDAGGIYEPVHGSAPDIAGKNLANPLAAINTAAMMFRFTFKNDEAAKVIEKAVEDVLDEGFRTKDLHTPGTTLLSCSEMGDKVVEKI